MEIQITYVTVSCDAEGCDKIVTFPNDSKEAGMKVVQDNPWMNSLRTVQTIDGRKFVYCSDTCTAVALGAGVFNKPLIEIPTTPNAAKLAAEAEARARQATQQLKTGGPVTLS